MFGQHRPIGCSAALPRPLPGGLEAISVTIAARAPSRGRDLEMRKGLLGCLVLGGGLLVLALILGGWMMGQYNSLVTDREAVNTAWSQVENVYQRRADLIPNLVETVKGVANFEKETYTKVAEARAQAGQVHLTKEALDDPETLRRFEAAQGQLSSAL